MPTHTISPAPAGGAPDRVDALIAEARHRVRGVTFDPCTGACPAAHLATTQLAAFLADEVERLRHRAEYAEQAIEALAVCSHAVLYSEASGQVAAVLGIAGQAAHQTYRGRDVTDVLHIARRNGVRADVLSRAAPTPAAPGAVG